MSTTRAIAHNTAYQLIGKISSTLLGVLALGLMTRYLGPEKFGWYITTMAFLQFVGILIDFGLIPVSAQMLSEPKHDKTKLLQNLLGFRFVSALIFLGLAPLVALLFPYPPEVKIAIATTSIAFLGVSMNQIFLGFYQTKLKMHIQAIGENIGRIILVTGLALAIWQEWSFMSIMVIVVLNTLGYTIFMWLSSFKYTRPTFAFDWSVWKDIIIKMWPLAISIIFNVIYLKGDILLLSLFRTQTEVGIYGAAYRVIDILAQMAMMIMGIMLPIMAFNWSRKLKSEFKKYYQQSFDIMMILAVPLTIGTIVLANRIMYIVGGTEFITSGKPLQILALAVFGVYLGAVFGHTAVSINKQKQTIWIYLSNAIITLTGYLIFIPKFGMYGAAGMTVFSEFYAGILLWLTIKYYTKKSLQLKNLAKIFFSGLVMGLSIWYCQKMNIFFLILLGALVYGTMIVLTKTISTKTLKEILKTKA